MSTMDTYSDPAPRVRPRALTVICVLAIVFGALGLLGGCIGLIGQLVSPEAMVAAQGATGEQSAGGMQEIAARSKELSAKYNPVMVPLTVVKILLEAALLVGGIMALGMKAAGRSLLSSAMIAAIIIESIQAVPNFMMQRESRALMAEIMPQVIAAQEGAKDLPPGMDMSAIMSGVGGAMIVLSLLWLVIKLVLYILGIRYLARPAMVAMFTSAPGSGRY
jgi:hypothetical protein